MNYSIIYYRYHVLGGSNLKYWGNRQPVPGEPLGQNTSTDYWLETVRTPKASLRGEKYSSAIRKLIDRTIIRWLTVFLGLHKQSFVSQALSDLLEKLYGPSKVELFFELSDFRFALIKSFRRRLIMRTLLRNYFPTRSLSVEKIAATHIIYLQERNMTTFGFFGVWTV